MALNKFDRAIFDFLTEPEHFEQAVKVHEHFGTVRHQLLDEFWDLVLEKLQDKIGDQTEKWRAMRHQSVDARWSSLWLVKAQWMEKVRDENLPLAVSWESLSQDIHYGIWINNVSQVWDISGMRDVGKKVAEAHNLKSDNHYWPANYYHAFNFNENRNLRHILPANREATADDFAGILWEIGTKFEDQLDQMYAMKA